VLAATLLPAVACGLSVAGEDAREAGAPDTGVANNDGIDATVDARSVALNEASTPLDDVTQIDAPVDAPTADGPPIPCESSPTSCGAPGACVDCATSSQGHACVVINGAQTCGCGGPANPQDCPAQLACRDMQCATACDGQHPCNGGCCSAATNGACVAVCGPGAACIVNVCM
jgi:hypothetical protein